MSNSQYHWNTGYACTHWFCADWFDSMSVDSIRNCCSVGTGWINVNSEADLGDGSDVYPEILVLARQALTMAIKSCMSFSDRLLNRLSIITNFWDGCSCTLRRHFLSRIQLIPKFRTSTPWYGTVEWGPWLDPIWLYPISAHQNGKRLSAQESSVAPRPHRFPQTHSTGIWSSSPNHDDVIHGNVGKQFRYI